MSLEEPESGYNKAIFELDKLKELLITGEKKKELNGHLTGEVTALFSKEEFCAMVEKAKHYIKEGDIFQIVLSNRLSAPFEGSLFNTYRHLRTINPSPYMFYFSGTDVEVAGASPETLVKLNDGVLHTFPLAGTRPRGKTEAEDIALEKELLADEKELVGAINPDIKVIRNDEMTIDEIRKLKPDRIILSPGPGRPENAGVIIETAKTVAKDIPTLGVCLGHQAICAAYGANVTYAKELMHGKQSRVKADTNSLLFKNCPETMKVARYHSLAADNDTIPDCLEVTAQADDGEVMAVQHKEYPIYGVQFHPESIMTPYGKLMIENFINGGM